ncbi:MAG: 16S rRNA (adenine(1518)-N(6)/adenine(1519)-N(6))-dimethyltransferase RsmA [Cellvibrionales bacterium TMED148]|nr:16S rRNA (adenine(1518)-N(6)/adenine(1519)-N(6))-dimethyltransferase [Porticoccaceae bacterium]RPG92091.1 MAG: 16S rRNA (adenine(1518)-N(6)/adenine(1519)-N(6))-dimethyltransferase RsmA [Cellvibrionales bacterium TMED148]
MNPVHHPRKRFGQNFLADKAIIEKIISFVNATGEDNLIEIGPGKGALTDFLVSLCPKMQAIEVDRELVQLLKKKYSRFKDFLVHEQDALKTDYANFKSDSKLRLIGNLPYNISTPLLFQIISQIELIKDLHFMLQKEVASRLVADPKTKEYGRLSVIVQYHFKVLPLIAVPPSAFRPIPQVESTFTRLVPHQKKPTVAFCEKLLNQIVKGCFQKRRKILRNSLDCPQSALIMLENEIDLSRRPEDLSVADFVKISNIVHLKRESNK